MTPPESAESRDVAEDLRGFLAAYPEDVYVMRELAYPVMRRALEEIMRLRWIIAPRCVCGHRGSEHEALGAGLCCVEPCSCHGYDPPDFDGPGGG